MKINNKTKNTYRNHQQYNIGMINKTKPTNQNRHGRNGKWTTQNLKQYENAKISRLQYLQNKATATHDRQHKTKNNTTKMT